MSLQSFINKVCPQVAVYWGGPRSNGYGGVVYDDPVEVRVRWDNVSKLMTDAKGKEMVCQAQVLVAGRLEDDGTVTPIDLDVDGRLYLGALDSLDSDQADNPIEVSGAWPIKRFDKNPEFKSTTKFVRQAFL